MKPNHFIKPVCESILLIQADSQADFHFTSDCWSQFVFFKSILSCEL